MHPHLETVYNELSMKYQYQTEYLQTVLEFFESINELLYSHEDIVLSNIIRRIVEPDRIISFKVIWEDDLGINQVNVGYRVQFNQALGPYKGGLRFNPSVNESIFKFLAFEQTFKNSLTGIPMGGAKGGSDFDPKGKSDQELLRFCRAFMIELYKYLGPDMDVPAGDIGVSAKAIGYMFGMYKRMTSRHNGSFTGKGLSYGGSLIRPEATGYGLIYMTESALDKFYSKHISGMTIVISGSGNVGTHAAVKAYQLGGIVVGVSSLDGTLSNPLGLDVPHLEFLRQKGLSIKAYLEKYPNTDYNENPKALWKVPCQIALPCATENELNLDDVKTLHKNGLIALLEGANMPTSLDATKYLIEHKVVFVPGKAANAGGVSVSGLEMQQNALHTVWDSTVVDAKLKQIMHNIFNQIYDKACLYHNPYDLVKGANITSFLRVYQAMIEQGL